MIHGLWSTIRLTSIIFIAVFLLAFVGQALAQTTEDSDRWSRWRMYEGETEWEGQEREQIRRWRDEQNSIRTSINNLPSTAETNVTIPILFGISAADLTKNFGDPRSGGRTHEGLDTIAPQGTPIASPTQAVVIRTGTGSSAGNYVYTANPGGETFVYMHLDRIAQGISSGTELQRGQILGFVGNTGNASGGAAHLHFELRSDGSPTDPFPRLQSEFSLQEKITSITNYLAAYPDEALVTLLVSEYADELRLATAQGIALPAAVLTALSTVPQQEVATTANAMHAVSGALPSDDLTIGSDGTAVVRLQQFLIAYDAGDAARYLGRSGATGYFGPITERALAEYQSAVGISPAVGYYGPVTRAYIAQADEVPHSTGTTASTGVSTTTTTTLPVFTRDLEYGSEGIDVLALQVLLNAHGFTVASSGAGSPGNETQYFGPATEAALVAFQKAHTITPAVGYFGPITRGVLATL